MLKLLLIPAALVLAVVGIFFRYTLKANSRKPTVTIVLEGGPYDGKSVTLDGMSLYGDLTIMGANGESFNYQPKRLGQPVYQYDDWRKPMVLPENPSTWDGVYSDEQRIDKGRV